MGCLFLIFAGLFPRLGVLFIWLARPELFLTAFGGFWLWPLLGIIFLPMTTLMYCLVWNPVGDIGGLDWVWLFLALMIDLGGALSSGHANPDRGPGYSAASRSTAAGCARSDGARAPLGEPPAGDAGQ